MGSDKLFHKRKAKAAESIKRRKALRAPYDKVLIVCEGAKTEPGYFGELVEYYEINSANVEIDGSCGSSPKSVFDMRSNCTRQKFEKEMAMIECIVFLIEIAMEPMMKH